ncbi:MAG: hypothetical protein AAFY88_24770, partial [Acidobacteriota bacterium]
MAERREDVAGPGEPEPLPPPGLDTLERVVVNVPLLHGLSFRQPPLCVRCGRSVTASAAPDRDVHLGQLPETRIEEGRGTIAFPQCARCSRGDAELSRFKKVIAITGLLVFLTFNSGDLELAIRLSVIGFVVALVSSPKLLKLQFWQQRRGRGPGVKVR